MTEHVRIADREWPPMVGTPASAQAIRHGCTCPLDPNLWGKRLMARQDWVLHRGCPVHGGDAPPLPPPPPPPPSPLARPLDL